MEYLRDLWDMDDSFSGKEKIKVLGFCLDHLATQF